MKLFIPRVPDDSSRKQLRNFIESGFKTKWWDLFAKKPKIISCELICITQNNGIKEHHGLVEVVPDQAAREVIRRLHGKMFNNKRIIVRQYSERAKNKISSPEDDQRRPNIEVENKRNLDVQGLEQFSRTYSNN